jgi:hypothetical protein
VPIRITVADRQRAMAAGVHGVLLQVARTDGLKFATGYGADHGRLPIPAANTPREVRCAD